MDRPSVVSDPLRAWGHGDIQARDDLFALDEALSWLYRYMTHGPDRSVR